MIILSVLLSNLREAVAITRSSTILSTTRSMILEAIESIQIPYDSIADPNKILGQSAKHNIAEKLSRYSSYLIVNDEGQIVATSSRNQNSNDAKDNNQTNAGIEHAEFPVQIAVAIVEEIDFPNKGIDCDNVVDIEEIAGEFAMNLHNKWGIGQEFIPSDKDSNTEKKCGGGTGVLVFLSVRDRVVFISVGGALDHLLTSGRIDRIIHNDMRSSLKLANYELGLTKGIDAIVELLEKDGEPSAFENITDKWLNMDNIFVFLCIMLVGNGTFQRWKRQREQRIYAKAAVRLSELDRARAEILRGSYTRTPSCPICLQDFSSAVLGSDGHPIQLLRCGHIFDKTCYRKWVSSGCGDVTKCPICRADVGFSFDDLPGASTRSINVHSHSLATNTGREGEDDPNDGSISNNSDLQRAVTNHDGVTFECEDDIGSNTNSDTHVIVFNRMERNYRLERLSQVYPRYIRADDVTRWSSPTFNGSIVRDPSFRNRDPAVTQNARQFPSSVSDNEDGFCNDNDLRGSYAFGGGTSTGGKGGRF